MENVEKILRDFVGNDTGRAVAVCDLARPEKVWAVHGETPMLAASVLKVPVAMRALEMFAEGKLDPQERVELAGLDGCKWSNLLEVLEQRDLSLRDVTALSIAVSDNASASHILRRVGMDEANALMARLGCGAGNRVMHDFTDAELIARGLKPENVLTATGMVKLLQALWTQPVYAPLRGWMLNNLRAPRLRNYLSHLDIYNKTGSLSGVVDDAGIITEGPRAVAVAVFTQGQADTAQTAVEIGRMARAVWETLD